MKFMAVICEYNPFHNGHAYQLEKQREALDCDGVICLMSGSFVQRGEPAVCDKWARAEMALACGADLVLELPVLYALQSAEGFARGGVSLLSKLGFEGYLCFGSETGDLNGLKAVAGLSESPDYHRLVRTYLETGVSYPKACGMAVAQLEPTADGLDIRPNDVLGVEYIRALQKAGSTLEPAVIQRKGAHNSKVAEDVFLSATGIRERLFAGQDIAPYIPEEAFKILKREIKAGRGPVTTEGLDALLCYVLNRIDKKELAGISGVSEGLENRLIEAANKQRSFHEIAMAAKTKRYPYTRICRVLLHTLLGMQKEDEAISPSYARILGVGKRGGAILRYLQKNSSVPFINKTADARFCDAASKRLFSLDVAATDLYALLYPKKNTGESGMDFCRSPVILFE